MRSCRQLLLTVACALCVTGISAAADTTPCPGEFIGDTAEDNPVKVSFLSSVDFWGSALTELKRGKTLRIGEPFQIELSYQKPLDCDAGPVALYEQRDGEILTRVTVKAADDSRKLFRSQVLTPVWEAGDAPGQVVLNPIAKKPVLIAKTRATTRPREFKRYAGQANLILPAFKKGRGDLSVRLLDYRGKPLREAVARQGEMKVISAKNSADVHFQYGNLFLARELPAGLSAVTLRILGSELKRTGVRVAERERTQITFGGPQELGEAGFDIHDYEYFEDVLNTVPDFGCAYRSAGQTVLHGRCLTDPLPAGDYTLETTDTLFPLRIPVAVRAGQSVAVKLPAGILMIEEVPKGNHNGRIYEVTVARDKESAGPVTFSGATRLILPAGRYEVEVKEQGTENVHRIPVNIAALRTTHFPIDKRTNPETLYYDPTGKGLMPGELEDFGELMKE